MHHGNTTLFVVEFHCSRFCCCYQCNAMRCKDNFMTRWQNKRMLALKWKWRLIRVHMHTPRLECIACTLLLLIVVLGSGLVSVSELCSAIIIHLCTLCTCSFISIFLFAFDFCKFATASRTARLFSHSRIYISSVSSCFLFQQYFCSVSL